MFYSDKFIFNGIHCDDLSIYLVSEESGVLNSYGIPFEKSSESEVTLSFCYADKMGIPLVWEEDVLSDVLTWLVSDMYSPFVSEDNEEVTYFLRAKSYEKKFTSELKGLLNITFESLSPYGYKEYVKKVKDTSNIFSISNLSNLNTSYKPVIEIKNIESEQLEISNITTGSTPFILKNLVVGKDIVVDCKLGTITDSDGKNLIVNSNRKWIELTKGVNKFTVTGTCQLIFKAYYPVMV